MGYLTLTGPFASASGAMMASVVIAAAFMAAHATGQAPECVDTDTDGDAGGPGAFGYCTYFNA